MKKSLKALGIVALMALATTASAQDINTVTFTVGTEMSGVVSVISAVAYISGIVIGIKAALKFKEFNESKGQGKVQISTPIVLAIVAVILLALPSYLKTTKETFFSSGSTGTELSGSTLQRVN